MALSAESTATCPYNRAHTIVLARMQFHLARCRQQYPYAEKTICPFNSTHVVNKVELDWHLEWCTSRITGERELFRVGSESKSEHNWVEVDILVPASTGEVWDEKETTGTSVLAMVKEVSQSKPTLSNKICASKAVRKQHKLDERRRFIEVFDSSGKKTETKEEPMKSVPVPRSEIQDFPQPTASQSPPKPQEMPPLPTPRSQPTPACAQSQEPQPSAWPQLQDAQNTSNQWIQQEKRRQQVQLQQALSRPQAQSQQDKWNGWKSVNAAEGLGQGMAQMQLSETRDRTNPWGAQRPTATTSNTSSSDFPQLPVSGRGKRIF